MTSLDGSKLSMKTDLPCRDRDESQLESEDSHFKSITSEKYCIRDTNQQVLVLQGNILVAVPDKLPKAGETFYVSASGHKKDAAENPIFLAVSKGELCLCCERVKEPNSPSLELKKKNIKELNVLEKQSLPFTFLREKVGSYFTLESAANRGYFIFTSSTPGQPVGVTKEIGKEKNTHFSFEDANVDLEDLRS